MKCSVHRNSLQLHQLIVSISPLPTLPLAGMAFVEVMQLIMVAGNSVMEVLWVKVTVSPNLKIQTSVTSCHLKIFIEATNFC